MTEGPRQSLSAAPAGELRGAKSRWRPSIALLLTGSIGALVVVAVGVLLFMLSVSARRNTEQLIADKAVLILQSVTYDVRQLLLPARAQVEFLARLMLIGEISPDQPESFAVALKASLAAAPHIENIVYIDPHGFGMSLSRDLDGSLPRFEPWGESHNVMAALASVERADEAFWGAFVVSETTGRSVLNMRVAVRTDGQAAGILLALVSIDELSEYVGRLSNGRGVQAFVLYGHNEVLAHPSLIGQVRWRPTESPLPALEEVTDVALRSIWDSAGVPIDSSLFGPGVQGHVLQAVDGRDYVYVHERLYGFGELPWIVGVLFDVEQMAAAFARIRNATLAGVALLVAATIAALLLGRWLSRPIVQLAAAAAAVRDVGVEQAGHLPRSRIAELDTAATTFNQMIEGLREREFLRDAFGRFLPKGIAEAIIRDRGALDAQTRVATIVFTDIAGFSTLSEAMAPAALVVMLNEYFSVVVEVVERHRGVIQQFQGDGMLATFNVPARDPEHALHAVMSAVQIQRALAGRRFGPGVELPTRVGINTGVVVGGTVGARSRLGYTVHGDTVNVAARLEQLNKQYGTRVLVSQATVDEMGTAAPFMAVGDLPIRGRLQSVRVYRLIDDTQLPLRGLAD